jgi:hypothetical protein
VPSEALANHPLLYKTPQPAKVSGGIWHFFEIFLKIFCKAGRNHVLYSLLADKRFHSGSKESLLVGKLSLLTNL